MVLVFTSMNFRLVAGFLLRHLRREAKPRSLVLRFQILVYAMSPSSLPSYLCNPFGATLSGRFRFPPVHRGNSQARQGMMAPGLPMGSCCSQRTTISTLANTMAARLGNYFPLRVSRSIYPYHLMHLVCGSQ